MLFNDSVTGRHDGPTTDLESTRVLLVQMRVVAVGARSDLALARSRSWILSCFVGSRPMYGAEPAAHLRATQLRLD